jgi:hypothetical protein
LPPSPTSTGAASIREVGVGERRRIVDGGGGEVPHQPSVAHRHLLEQQTG